MTTALQEAEQLVFKLTPAENAQMLQWIVRDIGNAFHGIERRPGVCGGAPCIARTRIPVWLVAQARLTGMSDVDVLRSYPTLCAEDVANAWAYYGAHREEIERQIRENMKEQAI